MVMQLRQMLLLWYSYDNSYDRYYYNIKYSYDRYYDNVKYSYDGFDSDLAATYVIILMQIRRM